MQGEEERNAWNACTTLETIQPHTPLKTKVTERDYKRHQLKRLFIISSLFDFFFLFLFFLVWGFQVFFFFFRGFKFFFVLIGRNRIFGGNICVSLLYSRLMGMWHEFDIWLYVFNSNVLAIFWCKIRILILFFLILECMHETWRIHTFIRNRRLSAW